MGAIITASVGILRVIRLQRELKAAKNEITELKSHENPVVDTEVESTKTSELEENDDKVK